MIAFRNFYWAAFCALLAVTSLNACSTLGYDDADIDTTRKAILVADAEVRGANMLLRDLVMRRVIPNDDAQSALNSLRTAHGHLQAALDAVSLSGDPVTAQSGLERANVALSIAITLLSAYTGGPGS